MFFGVSESRASQYRDCLLGGSGDLARISFNGLTSMKTPIRILFRVLINLLLACLLSFQVDEGLPEIGL